ncbi:hypothetical protein RJ639_020746 [Escallonia herrerae]|uniref:HAT C-terminal dimerisation domain-containing protein n=1 Tax=Escallonia herrerae TaxID=1293975 RepID=A0AA89AG21_9ASTE|nr:hypothetical protein RJ639_020746 [Escallonia herrerae]
MGNIHELGFLDMSSEETELSSTFISENLLRPGLSKSKAKVIIMGEPVGEAIIDEAEKANNLKYNIQSQMVVDIFSIPITTVASEAAFSTGGREKIKKEAITFVVTAWETPLSRWFLELWPQ